MSKKGSVTAKKSGNAVITVKEVTKKKPKKSRTVGKVKVTVKAKKVTTKPTVTSTPTTAGKQNSPTPAVTPTVTPKVPWTAYEWQEYDLASRLDQTGTYDAAKKTLTLSGITGVTFPLDSALAKGQVLAVEIKANITGTDGFRCWLSDKNGTVLSDRYNAASDQDFAEGENSLSFQVTAKKEADCFRIEDRYSENGNSVYPGTLHQ